MTSRIYKTKIATVEVQRPTPPTHPFIGVPPLPLLITIYSKIDEGKGHMDFVSLGLSFQIDTTGGGSLSIFT
jgi:hypothetical protein